MEGGLLFFFFPPRDSKQVKGGRRGGGGRGAIEISTRTANQGCPRCKCLSPDVDDKDLDQLPWQGQNCSRLSR